MKTKILKITGLALLILTTLLWSAPYLFKGKIVRLVRERANKDLRAHVNFSDLDISWFRHFPKISVGLDNLQVACVGEFDEDTLLSAKRLDFAVSPFRFISGDTLQIYSITAYQPRIHVHIHKNGHRNWDILNPDQAPSVNSGSDLKPFTLAIQRYALYQGFVNYQDESRNIQMEIVNLEHEGRGNFNSDQFILNTSTSADALHFNYEGAIPYHVTAKTRMDLAVQVDNKSHTYTFKTDKVFLNDLKLNTEGFFQWVNDSSYDMNIRFNASKPEFKHILSFLPSVYQKDFASIKSSGQVFFNGFVRGKYDGTHVPAYHVNLDIENGFFQYPDLPMPLEHINLAIRVDNTDGVPDHITVNIHPGHFELDNNALNFHVLVKNPSSDPFIDASFSGKLDLANITKLIKLPAGSRMSGLMNADFNVKGTPPGKEKKLKDPFKADGSFDLKNFEYVSKAYPGGIAIKNLELAFNPKNVLLKELKAEYLSSQLSAQGGLDNFFAYAIGLEPLNGSFHVKADEINLNDWMGSHRDSAASQADVHPLSAFAVPDHIHFNIDAEAEKLHYDNLDLQHLSGSILVDDQTLQFNPVKAEALDGTMVIHGNYSTKEGKENPEIALNYDLNGMDVQKTFFAFNTLQKLMPLGKFISGKFNSQMSLNGRLHANMEPDLKTLNGEGNLYLTEGSLKEFGPLDKVSQSLDIAALKDLALKDIKADFSFKAGRVVLAPFLVHAKNLDMEIAGTHGFDQSLDYDMRLVVPRTELGSKGNEFVKNVVTDAAGKGIPVKLNDAVSMNVKMSGSINNPDIKTDMNATVDLAASELKKEVNEFVNAKLDSARQQLHHPANPSKKEWISQASFKSKKQSGKKKVSAHNHKKTTHPKSRHKQRNSKRYSSTS